MVVTYGMIWSLLFHFIPALILLNNKNFTVETQPSCLLDDEGLDEGKRVV